MHPRPVGGTSVQFAFHIGLALGAVGLTLVLVLAASGADRDTVIAARRVAVFIPLAVTPPAPVVVAPSAGGSSSPVKLPEHVVASSPPPKPVPKPINHVAYQSTISSATIVVGPVSISVSGINWDRVARCESSNTWDDNTGNGYFGGLQITMGNWLNPFYGGLFFALRPDLATRDQQIIIAERIRADQGMGAWPHCRVYG